MSLRRPRIKEKCNELPQLPLLWGQKQEGTKHPISKNHIICTCHKDKDVSLKREYDQACMGTESPPAGPRSRLSQYKQSQLFPSQVMLLTFPKQETGPWGPTTLPGVISFNKTCWGLPRKFPGHLESFSGDLDVTSIILHNKPSEIN